MRTEAVHPIEDDALDVVGIRRPGERGRAAHSGPAATGRAADRATTAGENGPPWQSSGRQRGFGQAGLSGEAGSGYNPPPGGGSVPPPASPRMVEAPMRHFLRVLRYSWPYRYRLLASVFCALFVARPLEPEPLGDLPRPEDPQPGEEPPPVGG